MISIRRRPSRSDSRPPSSSSPPKASEYAVTTHCRSALENPSARWAEGSAMFTIVASSTTISWASPTTPRIHQRRADAAAASIGLGLLRDRDRGFAHSSSLNRRGMVQEGRPSAAAARRARQTRCGDAGMSMCRTPRGASASMIAFCTAGVEPMVPASPMPLAPSGL